MELDASSILNVSLSLEDLVELAELDGFAQHPTGQQEVTLLPNELFFTDHAMLGGATTSTSMSPFLHASMQQQPWAVGEQPSPLMQQGWAGEREASLAMHEQQGGASMQPQEHMQLSSGGSSGGLPHEGQGEVAPAGKRPRGRAKARAPDAGRAAGVKVSRWTQRKETMKAAEKQASAGAQQACELEAVNNQLKRRALAMQYTLEAREKQLSILETYSRCKREPCPDSSEAQALQIAATSSLSTLTSKLHLFVREASSILLRMEMAPGGVDDGSAGQLARLVSDLCTMAGTAFVLNPKMQFEMLLVRADRPSTGAAALDAPPPGHWERVAREVRATPQQLDEIAACAELNHNVLVKLQSDIDSVQEELSREMAANPASARLPELQKHLSAALLKQGMACRSTSFILFTRILAAPQTARALVHSYPFFPNSREIVIRLLSMRGK